MALRRVPRIRHLPHANAHRFPIFGRLLLTGVVSLRPVTRDNPGEMGGRVASPTLVGRVEELELLEAARVRAAKGELAVVLVGGEAGIGKTRLLAELTSRCATDGTRVLVGGCVPVGGDGLPYAPIVEALRGLLGEVGVGAVRELVGPSWPELARLLPALGEPEAGPAGQAAQARLFELLLGLLGRLGEQAPLVLVVEDLHWADRSTRDLLAFLVRNLRRERVLLVVTYRNDEPGQQQLGPYLAELDRGGRVERIELARLDQVQTEAQLVGILGAAPTAELVDAVFARSEGNPFFTEELLAVVRAGSGELPATLQGLLRGRVQALPQPAQQVLGVVAVAGRPVPHRLLAAVAGLDDPHLDAALRAGVADQLLVIQPGEDGYEFRHALLREVVEADLLPGERIRLHAEYARALAERPELAGALPAVAAAELASHWDGAGEPARALPARVAAGLAAEHARAFAEADRHYQRALELWDEVTDPVRLAGLDQVELLARAAEAAAQTGTTDHAIGLLEQALSHLDPAVDPVGAATLLSRLGGHRHTALDHAASLADYAEAERLLAAAAPSAEQAAVLADHAHELEAIGRPQEAIPLLEEAISVARLVGARAEEAFALATLACCLDSPDEVERSIALHLEARRLAEEVGDAEILIDTYVTLGVTLELAGRGQDALVDAREGYLRACQLGLEHAVGSYVASHLAWQLLAAGRWAECERLTAEVLAIDSWDAYDLHAVQGQLLARRGDFAAAHEQLDQARRTTPAADRDPAWAERAELALWEGNDQAASAAIAEGLRWRTKMEPSRALSQYTSPLSALALRLAADQAGRAAARRATDELAQIQGQAASITAELDRLISMEVPMARHPGVRCNLLLAQAERSRLKGASDPGRWQQAAAAWERLERPFEAAYARFRQAEALLASGAARDQAEAALRPAHRTAVTLGAGPLQREIERLAQRGRLRLQEPVEVAATPEASSLASSLGLTRREVEVLALVGEGRTNRQIGQALFITPKTASVHVSRILAKLGVAGRGEAAAIAHRLGLDKQ
jgi:DNA-binding CsgD family transcriptional regulator/tetratricopeptide (TPR) repeat protein